MPKKVKYDESKSIKIRYVNYRGEESIRRIIPINILWSTTKWHTNQQWFLHAYDIDRKDKRSFTLKDVKEIDA